MLLRIFYPQDIRAACWPSCASTFRFPHPFASHATSSHATSSHPTIAPYLRTALPTCSIVLDRHVHKNGGSTIRDLFLMNEMHDDWLYWGYGLAHTQRVVAGLIELLLGPPNRSCTDWSRRPVLRVAAELHYSRVMTAEAMMVAFGPWSPLQQLASHCGCRLVMVTRLREPLDFYLSFYRWVRRGCTRLPCDLSSGWPRSPSTGRATATGPQPRGALLRAVGSQRSYSGGS